MFPDFIIAGAPKCGSTSLFELIRQHPETCMSKLKEPYFYLRDWGKSPLYYHENYFPSCIGNELVGEGSVDYMYSLEVAERIFSVKPDTKFIFIFRNPVDRAFSHYWQDVKDGRETTSWKALVSDGLQKNIFQYGFYFRSLKSFFKTSGPFPNSHIVIFEDFIKNPQEEYNKICKFLALKTIPIENPVFINKGVAFRNSYLRAFFLKVITSKSLYKITPHFLVPVGKTILYFLNTKNSKSMSSEKYELEKVRPFLSHYYSKDVEELENYLGRSLPW